MKRSPGAAGRGAFNQQPIPLRTTVWRRIVVGRESCGWIVRVVGSEGRVAGAFGFDGPYRLKGTAILAARRASEQSGLPFDPTGSWRTDGSPGVAA